MKIYTKTGDKGETSLVTGTRVPKYHLRIECYGTVDELNSQIGLLHALSDYDQCNQVLYAIQNRLFSMASRLSADKAEMREKLPQITAADIQLLEDEIDKMNEKLPPLKNFILPGGHQLSATCHVARTVCRRAERLAVRLAEEVDVEDLLIQYLNRLSDYLFVLARRFTQLTGSEEVIWKSH